MAEDFDALLTAARRRELALAAVLSAVTSGNDLQTVLLDIAAAASDLFQAMSAGVFVLEGDEIGMYAEFATPDGELRRRGRRPRPNDRTSSLAEVLRERSVMRFDDQSALGDEYAQSRDAATALGIKSSVYVPVPTGGAAVGMCVFRDEVDPFTDDDVALLQSFASQAAHAVESARRADELRESLQLQTATSEVLRLISDHPGDLPAVMHGLVERAVRLVDGDTGAVARFDGDTLTLLLDTTQPDMAGVRAPLSREFSDAIQAGSSTPARVDDIQRLVGAGGVTQEMVRDIRSCMIAPLHADGRPFGMLLIGRFEVRPFDERDGEVLQTFAEQAAIAISNARLFNDLDAALERQTAMTEVLDVVSTARVDLQPVYDVIGRQAMRLLGYPVLLAIRDGDELVEETPTGAVSDSAARLSEPGMRWPIDERSPVGYACLHGEVVDVRDWSTMPADVFPDARGRVDDSKASLVVPMLRNGVAVGIVGSMGPHVADLSDAQVALLQTFANQAAIAVDNARLLREIEDRNVELGESLELQTATSEVLALISTSPGDLDIVLSGILEKAAAICDAEVGAAMLRRISGTGQEVVRAEAVFGGDTDSMGNMEFPPMRTTLEARRSRQPVMVDDLAVLELEASVAGAIREFGLRSQVSVPLFDGDDWIGNLNLYRREVRPFEPQHATALQRFADQAAIAIANARLFNDLDEALARQTAMTDVLDAVATARTDLQPVFDAITRHAYRLVGHGTASLLVKQDDGLARVSFEATPAARAELEANPGLAGLPSVLPLAPGSSPHADAVLTGEIVNLADLSSPLEQYPDFAPLWSVAVGAVVLPLLRHGEAVGALAFSRSIVGAYTDAEIGLLQGFANQAAIAVDNARLLREIEDRNSDLAESLELQTATSEVLRLISDHPGDLDKVFDGIVRQVAMLCGADAGAILLREGDELVQSATSIDANRSLIGQRFPITGSIDLTEPVFVDDLDGLLGRQSPVPIRSLLSAPMVVDGVHVGQLNAVRNEVRPFDQRHAKIVQGFAEQAAIAISNARLFNDLDAALTRQTANAEILRVISTSPGDLGRTLPEIALAARRLTSAFDIAITYGDDSGISVWDEPRGFRTMDAAIRVPGSNQLLDSVRATRRPDQLVGPVEQWFATDPFLASLAEADCIVEGVVLLVPMQGSMGKTGFILARRKVPVPFSAEEIAMLEEFTAQAVIAFDNADLLAALESRNNDLAESLELQTATSEVLTLISANPGDLRVVLDGIAERAAALGGAATAQLMLVDGDVLRFEGMWSMRDDLASVVGWEVPISLAGFNLQARDRRVPRFVDDFASWAHERDDPTAQRFDEFAVRSFVSVALLRGDDWLGNINLGRFAVDPFDPKVGPMLQAFADQAVLAIQNAELFTTLEARNREVKAALEQQIAVGAVLQTISRSAFDLGAVLNELAEQANRLVGGFMTAISLLDGVSFVHPSEFRTGDGRADALYNGLTTPDVIAFYRRRKRPFYPTFDTPESTSAMDPSIRLLFDRFGPFCNANVPLMQGENVLGIIAIGRLGLDQFADAEKRLLQTFADQAVIAVENARLFRELEERNREVNEALEQQTAIAEVLEIISSSPTDLEPVLSQVLGIAARLCEAEWGLVWQARGERFEVGATHGFTDDEVASMGDIVYLVGEAHVVQQCADGATRRADISVEVIDGLDVVNNDPATYPTNVFIQRFRAQSYLLVPLTRPGSFSGVFSLMRKDQRPFTDRDEAIVQTFADQALIAIENSRLFHELEDSNRDVKAALEQQTAVGAVLQTISRSAFDLGAVLNELAEQAYRLVGGSQTGIVLVDRQESYAFPPEIRTADGHADPLYNSYSSPAVIEFFVQLRGPFYVTISADDPAWADDPIAQRYLELNGTYTHVSLPLLQEDRIVGFLIINRTGTTGFNDSEKRLLQTFADQAVIAIENARLFRELEERNREVSEALEQQTAIAEVLEIISSSPTDLEPVLNQVLGIAARLCDADIGLVWQRGADRYVVGASHGLSAEQVIGANDSNFEVGVPHVVELVTEGRLLRFDVDLDEFVRARAGAGRVVLADRSTLTGDEQAGRPSIEFVRHVPANGYLMVPLTRPGSFAGVFSLMRWDRRPFSERDEAIVQTFADQALIAIENSRLFHELEESNREVSAALNQQTAVASVLQTISRSAFDLDVVLNELVEQAHRLVPSIHVAIRSLSGRDYVTTYVYPADHHDHYETSGTAVLGEFEESVLGRNRLIATTVRETDRGVSALADAGLTRYGSHSVACVPMRSSSGVVGLMSVIREGESRFTDAEKQVLQTFADQAVIAIENSRLFRELEESNSEVSAALEQQTAVAAVLQTISRSAFDIDTVLDELATQAHRLVGGFSTVLNVYRDGALVPAATVGHTIHAVAEAALGLVSLVIEGRRPRYFTAQRDDPSVAAAFPAFHAEMHRLDHTAMSVAFVPLISGTDCIGAVSVTRTGDARFTDSEKQLLQTFADQAVIAIENARLFRELEESNHEVSAALEQQTAVAAVLQTISRSAFDLDTVLNELAEQAHRLVDGYATVLNVYRGQELVPAAAFGDVDEALLREGLPYVSQVIDSGRPSYVVRRQGDAALERPVLEAGMVERGHHALSTACIPLMGGGGGLGAVVVARAGDTSFTDAEKQLLQTFADQAVIAIENARLFSELQAKTEELEIASRHKSEFLANMSHELRTPLNAIIGYAELIAEECADLGTEEFLPDLGKIQSAGKHLLTLISGILDLAKVEAGRMDLFVERIDIAAMVTEVDQIVRPLVEKNRNTLVLDCPPGIGAFDADLVKVKQVLFNLLSNSAKFTDGGTITLAIRRHADTVDFAITDTGIGMNDEQMGRLFEAFSQADVSTTRKYGGTGLGLALSRSFCQKMGGDITVTSDLGAGSTYTVTQPGATSAQAVES